PFLAPEPGLAQYNAAPPGALPAAIRHLGVLKLMNWHRFHRLGIAVATVLVVAACGSSSTAGATDWSKQTSASGGGGMDALVKAAKAEGKLTVIALPPDWANYGAVISGFKAKYNIDITSLNPNGSSQDEVNAFDGTSRAPDVVDVGQAVALA